MSTNKNQNPEMMSAAIGLLTSRRNARLKKALKFVRAAAGLDDAAGNDQHSVWRDELRVVEFILSSIRYDGTVRGGIGNTLDLNKIFREHPDLEEGYRDCEVAWISNLAERFVGRSYLDDDEE